MSSFAIVAFAACSKPVPDAEPQRASVVTESALGELPSSASALASAVVAPSVPTCPESMVRVRETFCLDRTEVTTEAYAACVAAGHCSAPLRGGSCSYERAGASKRPINCVGFLQAETFCKVAGKRLPTEAEWESAAGAGVRMYPWGDEPPGKGVCWDGTENALGHGNRHDSCEVGTFEGDVSPDGARDLGGNLTEWTVPEGRLTARDPNQIAPRRGGTWGTKSGPFLLRTTSRRVGEYDPYHSGIFTGFRCAADFGTGI